MPRKLSKFHELSDRSKQTIGDFQIGLKMILKLAKNSQNLHSDYEQRGQGKRIKCLSSKRLFDNLDSECSVDEDFEVLENRKKVRNTLICIIP